MRVVTLRRTSILLLATIYYIKVTFEVTNRIIIYYGIQQELNMTNGYESGVTRANKPGKSLRTTIPAAIRDHFGIKEKDKLIWKIEIKDNDFIIVVKPVKKEDEE